MSLIAHTFSLSHVVIREKKKLRFMILVTFSVIVNGLEDSARVDMDKGQESGVGQRDEW